MSVSSELEAKTEDNSVLLRPIPEIDVPDFGTLNRKQVTKDLKENDELNSKIYYQFTVKPFYKIASETSLKTDNNQN